MGVYLIVIFGCNNKYYEIDKDDGEILYYFMDNMGVVIILVGI